jgi:aspartate/methionine/tyrosine aminotransferase
MYMQIWSTTTSRGSFSKDFSLCGWRVGFAHGPERYIQSLLGTHDRLINCAPAISQFAALAALQNKDNILPESKAFFAEHRTLMGNALMQLSRHLEVSWPEGACFFFCKVKNEANTEALAFDILEKAKVAVVPGTDFGCGGEGYLRLCFGRSLTDITEGVQRLSEYLNRH